MEASKNRKGYRNISCWRDNVGLIYGYPCCVLPLMSSALLYGKQLFMSIHICIILRQMSYGHKGIMLKI